MGRYIIKMRKGKTESYWSSAGAFKTDIDSACEYARMENAERELRAIHKHGRLDKHLLDGAEFFTLQVTLVEMSGVKMDIKAKSTEGFVIQDSNGKYYNGPKKAKQYGFNLTGKYDSRTIFKTEKDALDAIERVKQDYLGTAEHMEKYTPKNTRNTYWDYHTDTLTWKVVRNH